MKCQQALIDSEADSCFDWMESTTTSAPPRHPNESKNIVIDINKVVKAYRKEDPTVESKGVLTKLMSFKKDKKTDKKVASASASDGDISNYTLHCPTYWFVAAWEHVVRIPAVGIDRLMELVQAEQIQEQKGLEGVEAAKAGGGTGVDENSTEVDSDDEVDESDSNSDSKVKTTEPNSSTSGIAMTTPTNHIPHDFDEDRRMLSDFLVGGNGGVANTMDILGIKDCSQYEDAVRIYWEEEVSTKKFGCIFMNTPISNSNINSVAASPAPNRADSQDDGSPTVSTDGLR